MRLLVMTEGGAIRRCYTKVWQPGTANGDCDAILVIKCPPETGWVRCTSMFKACPSGIESSCLDRLMMGGINFTGLQCGCFYVPYASLPCRFP